MTMVKIRFVGSGTETKQGYTQRGQTKTLPKTEYERLSFEVKYYWEVIEEFVQ